MAVAVTQSRFRFRSDTGTVDGTPTWAQNENVNHSIANNTAFRLRFELYNSGSTSTGSQAWRIFARRNGAGSYTQVTASTSFIQSSSAASSDSDNTALATTRLTNDAPGTPNWVNGQYDNSGATGNITLGAGNTTAQKTEVEFGLILSGCALNDYIDFRVYRGTSTALNTYTVTARVTASDNDPNGFNIFTPSIALDTDNSDTNSSVREALEVGGASLGLIRIQFQPNNTGGANTAIAHMSVGKWDGNSSYCDTTAVPVEVKFGGSSGLSRAAGAGTIWSDWTDISGLTVNSGDSLVVIIDGTGTCGYRTAQNGANTTNTYVGSGASYNQQTWHSGSDIGDYDIGIAGIETKAPSPNLSPTTAQLALTTSSPTVGIGAPSPNLSPATAQLALTSSAPSVILSSITASKLTGISSDPASGTYGSGTAITFTLTFDAPVTVSGTPELYLNTGGKATYQSGSGTTSLTYVYTIGAGDTPQANLQIIGSNPYKTSFPNVENPLSESGAWLKRATDHANLRTMTSPARVVGTQTGTGNYDDSYACLQGFPNDYTLTATVYRDTGNSDDDSLHEIELLGRMVDTTTTTHCYELNLSHNGGYIHIMAWTGNLGQFATINNGPDPVPYMPPVTGDSLRLVVSGTTITGYIDKHGGAGFQQLITDSDSAYTTGQPGIGMWLQEPATDNTVYGFKDFLASAAGAAISNSDGNSVDTVGVTQTFTGLAITVGSVNRSPASASLTLSTSAPTINLTGGINLSPASAQLTITAAAATLFLTNRYDLSPTSAALTLSAAAPTLLLTDRRDLSPSNASLTLTSAAPTIFLTDRRDLSPASAQLTLSMSAPTVAATQSGVIQPATASLTLSTSAPTVAWTDKRDLSPASASLALSTAAPMLAVTDRRDLSPSTASLTLTGAAPTVFVTARKDLSPDAAALAISTAAPTVELTNRLSLSPASASLAITATSPTVLLTNRRDLSPAGGALTLTTAAPTVALTQKWFLSPPTANLTLSSNPPDVQSSQSFNKSPTTAVLSLSTAAPTVTLTEKRFLSPATASLSLTTAAPNAVVSINHPLSPARAALTITTAAPTVFVTSRTFITPPTAQLAISLDPPAVAISERWLISPPSCQLVLTTEAPKVEIDRNISPTSAEIVLSSDPPTIARTYNHELTIESALLMLTTAAPTVLKAPSKRRNIVVGRAPQAAQFTGRAPLAEFEGRPPAAVRIIGRAGPDL